MNGIEIKDVTKMFQSTKALNHINLTFEEHKIYGLLGRNGAGKSTLLNIINNRLLPTQGSVLLNGKLLTENDELLRNFYLANEKLLYPEGMKIKDIFKWSKEFYPDFDTDYAVYLSELFTLPMKKKVKTLSTGYQSIFKNIIALSVNVPYVFLDEPVLGLDAYHRDLFYKLLIEKYSDQPFTVIISTHLIEEISNIIEDIIIIKSGEVIKNESKESLLNSGYTVSGPDSLVTAYIADKKIIGLHSLGGLKTACIMGSPDKHIPSELELSKMNLQHLFIELTNI